MKKLFTYSLISLLAAGNALASIIIDSNMGLTGGGSWGNYSLFAYPTEEAYEGEVGNIFINRDGTLLTNAGALMGSVSVGLKLSQFGAELGEGTSFNNTLDVGYGDFYMSVIATSYNTSEPTIGKGWALLNNSEAGLRMLKNAMEYEGNTLTVGAIPEPSSVALLTLSGVIIYLRNRKK